MAGDRGNPHKLAILWALYFVQGLPFGFQATALPVYLRAADFSLTSIGLVSILSVPWMLKVFWAPLVDRFGSASFGHRRSWIVPLQIGLAICCLAASRAAPAANHGPLLILVLLMNLFAATMDIAVDGLAIDLLDDSELGKGNIAQVVGFKGGMLTGGGLLVWASGWIGWEGLFLVMAGLIGAIIAVTLAYHERSPQALVGSGSSTPLQPSLRRLLEVLRGSLLTRGTGWLLLFIGTYKLGENMADTMFKPFLVDAGFGRQQIGLWVGTWGMFFSIAGSITGGFLATRRPLLQAVAITAVWRALPMAGEWWLSIVEPTATRVIAVTCAEHFFGGALTTAMFAFMMSRVNKRIGATHYTLLAAVEVWGKVPAAAVSGAITDATSYTFVFGLATVLSLAFLGLLVPLGRLERTATAASAEPSTTNSS